MATDIVPAVLPHWTFEKAQSHGSPASGTSSSASFTSEEKLRITPSEEEINQTLDETTALLSPDYQSSEEALSPVMDDTESETDELEVEGAGLDAAGIAEKDLWDEISVIALDIAVALSMRYVGPPKMIDLEQLYSNSTFQVAPLRIDTIPPRSERRTQVREIVPSLKSRFSGSSTDPLSPTELATPGAESPESSHSRFSGSSYSESPSTASHKDEEVRDSASYTESLQSSKRNGSVFSIAAPTLSSTWTTPQSEMEYPSPAASFLQSDPFENSAPPTRKLTHSRLRSISSKFSKLHLSLRKDPQSDEVKRERKARRGSFMRPSTPSSLETRFSGESKGSLTIEPALLPPSFISSPLEVTPTQRTFPRKVARGADERAATIRIPPCPIDYSLSLQPERLQPEIFDAPPRRATGPPVLVKRRKSVLLA